MGRVNLIGPNGEKVNVPEEQVEAVKAAGYREATPGIMSGLMGTLKGALGGAGKYVAAGAGATGGGMGFAPRYDPTASTYPQNMAAARQQDEFAQKDNPGTYGVGQVTGAVAPTLAGGALGGLAKGGIQRAALRAAPEGMEDFSLGAALNAARPGLKDVGSMWAGSHIGGMLGAHEAGAAMGMLPWAARVGMDPRVDYQAAKLLPIFSRLMGMGTTPVTAGANIAQGVNDYYGGP